MNAAWLQLLFVLHIFTHKSNNVVLVLSYVGQINSLIIIINLFAVYLEFRKCTEMWFQLDVMDNGVADRLPKTTHKYILM
jgi:hypothetical protein